MPMTACRQRQYYAVHHWESNIVCRQEEAGPYLHLYACGVVASAGAPIKLQATAGRLYLCVSCRCVVAARTLCWTWVWCWRVNMAGSCLRCCWAQ